MTGYDIFGNTAAENALATSEKAIAHRSKPASVMTDHGSQFYANKADARKWGESEFEKKPADIGIDIRHIQARIKHQQTNGNLERICGKILRKLSEFGSILMQTGNPYTSL